MRQFGRDEFANRYVAALFGVQVAGWIVLVATVDHSPTSLIGWVQALPGSVRLALLPVAILALPAVVLSLVIGTVLSVFGRPPEFIPALLVTQGDVLVFGSAYLLAVGGAWAIRNRVTRPE